MKLFTGAAEAAGRHGRMKNAKLMQVHRFHLSKGLHHSIFHIRPADVNSQVQCSSLLPDVLCSYPPELRRWPPSPKPAGWSWGFAETRRLSPRPTNLASTISSLAPPRSPR